MAFLGPADVIAKLSQTHGRPLLSAHSSLTEAGFHWRSTSAGVNYARDEADAGLGRVDIHFSQIMAATRNSTAANDETVFS
jgi:hypothetical protein